MKKIIFLLILLISIHYSNAAVCTATSGDWTSPSIWSCGAVPGCADSVVIPAGITVNITSQLDYSSCGTAIAIVVYGELHFQTGQKLHLPRGSMVYVMTGGSVTKGGGGGNSNLIDVCGVTIWSASMGNVPGPVIIQCCSPLPIELLSFNAKYTEGKVILNWSTASQINNDYFTIERSSDGINYQIIGTVDGAGNNNEIINYSFIDYKPLKEISYYRLKQTDFDGKSSNSKVVSIANNDNSSVAVRIYPNPNNGHFFVESNSENSIIAIYDPLGKKVFDWKMNTQLMEIDLSNLSNGIYSVQISSVSENNIYKISILK